MKLLRCTKFPMREAGTRRGTARAWSLSQVYRKPTLQAPEHPRLLGPIARSVDGGAGLSLVSAALCRETSPLISGLVACFPLALEQARES